MYICKHCDREFEEPDLNRAYDRVDGNCFASGWEEWGTCPYCGREEYEEAHQCAECGGWFLEDDLHDGFCAECVKDSATEYGMVLSYAEHENMVSEFIEKLLTDEERKEILLSALTAIAGTHYGKQKMEKALVQFACEDIDAYAGFVDMKRRGLC